MEYGAVSFTLEPSVTLTLHRQSRLSHIEGLVILLQLREVSGELSTESVQTPLTPESWRPHQNIFHGEH